MLMLARRDVDLRVNAELAEEQDKAENDNGVLVVRHLLLYVALDGNIEVLLLL